MELLKKANDDLNNEKKQQYGLTQTQPYPSEVQLERGPDVPVLCINLFLKSVISFRSIPRVLEQFSASTSLNVGWRPHFTSVINWVLRLGIGVLNQVKKRDEDWVAIVDHSIGIGTKKALVVLRVPIDALFNKGKAVTLADCECIGLDVAEKVNGETTAAALNKIFDRAGTPVGIIKDCDATLNKAVRLVCEHQDRQISIIDDIGHSLAVALKAEYDKQPTFRNFVSIAAKGAKYLYQTSLAFLVPPKLRTKGRYQSMSHLGEWAIKILDILSGKDDSKSEPENKIESETESEKKAAIDFDKLYEAFHDLEGTRDIIKSFCNTCEVITAVMALLKNKGLDWASHEKCCELCDTLPEASKVKIKLQTWLDKHIELKQWLTKLPMLISSDIIESLFGQFKYILSRGTCVEMNRSVLFIPAMCGIRSDLDIRNILENTSLKDVNEWERDNMTQTLNQARREISKKSDVQKLVKIVPG